MQWQENNKSMQTLKNALLSISSTEHGAELTSIVKDGREYLWQADPAFWKRHSPVLFPIVGSVWNGRFRIDGKEYAMGQHGFARDRDFSLIEQSESKLKYRLESDSKSLEIYPYPFRLDISYHLRDNQIDVIWEVENIGSSTLYFQIGAHPAFNYFDFDPRQNRRGYFSFDRSEGLECIRIVAKGCADPSSRYPLKTDSAGLLPIYADSFDETDAFILQDSQVKKVTLHDPNGVAKLSLDFDSPLVGLWSPPHKNAPFVCIEPWFGRCDRAGYEGEFKNRDWVNELAPSQRFKASYTITIF